MAVSSIINRQMVNVGDSTSSIARVVGVVESSMTLNVPSDFSTLQEAMNWIEARILLDTVTIKIADGTYNTGQHTIRHNNYLMVDIIGNTSNPSNVTFNSSGGSGFYIEGCPLKSLQGVKVVCSSGIGIYVNRGGQIHELNYVEITGCGGIAGLMVHDRCFVKGTSINTHNNTGYGVANAMMSTVNISYTTSSNNQWGFFGVNGSQGRLLGSTTTTGNSAGNYSPGLNQFSTSDGSFWINS